MKVKTANADDSIKNCQIVDGLLAVEGFSPIDYTEFLKRWWSVQFESKKEERAWLGFQFYGVPDDTPAEIARKEMLSEKSKAANKKWRESHI